MIEMELEALAAGVDELVTAVRAAGDNAAWDFDTAGPAAADWAANEQPSGWGNEPLEDAYRTGALLWNLVADQALSTAVLLRAGRPLGGLAQGRALAESCAPETPDDVPVEVSELVGGIAGAEVVAPAAQDRVQAVDDQRSR
jgi:hypothetical protein